jgi:hypothetical protein
MTRVEAFELRDFIDLNIDHENVTVRRRRLGGQGWSITVQLIGAMPCTFIDYHKARAYCGLDR